MASADKGGAGRARRPTAYLWPVAAIVFILSTLTGRYPEPGFLGVSQGAAFRAALALVLGAQNDLAVAFGAFLFALASLITLRAAGWRLSILSLENTVSFSLGARPGRERGLILAVAVGGVAAMTAVSGIVSWGGLIVPHAARLLAGADGRSSMPASIATGAVFVLACDVLSRTLLPGELPLGVATAFLGTAAFTALLLSRAVTVVR